MALHGHQFTQGVEHLNTLQLLPFYRDRAPAGIGVNAYVCLGAGGVDAHHLIHGIGAGFGAVFAIGYRYGVITRRYCKNGGRCSPCPSQARKAT